MSPAATPSFADLLAFYQPRVQRAALGWLGDEQEAREVAQDALVRAWKARDRYDSRRPFYPWLYTIVKNACRDARDRRHFRAVGGLDSDRVTSPSPDPLALATSHEAAAQVRAALERLDPDQREILVLRHFEDLAYGEIAALLGVPEGTVMSRLFRARRALLTIMKEGA